MLVYGNTISPDYIFDCSTAAQNIMLAAYEMGLGSCWIGFAMALGNTGEIKERFNVPEQYKPVAPLAIGYPRGAWPPIPRKEPVIFAWKRNLEGK